MRAFIIHGAYGHPEENWFPWLKEKLGALGWEVHVPKFPTPKGQTLENWIKTFQKFRPLLDDSTVLIGHSLGVPFILHLLETLERPVKASYLIAGFSRKIGIPEFDEINSTFLGNFDWKKIRENCERFVVFHSDNDPYVPLDQGKEIADRLNAEFHLIKGAGHFNEKAGYTKFPELLKEFFPNEITFLLHGETKIDPSKPVSSWVLSRNGKKEVEKLANSGIFNNVDIIISSTEPKAIQTAEIIASRIKKNVIQFPELKELDRDSSGFLEKEEFERTVEKCLKNPEKSIRGWEPANKALARFQSGVIKINEKWKNKRILVVSHGLVVNLFFARMLGKRNAWERVKKTSFCSWGVIKFGEVTKDLIESLNKEPNS